MDRRFFIVHFLMRQKQNQEKKLCGMSVRKFAVLTDDKMATPVCLLMDLTEN